MTSIAFGSKHRLVLVVFLVTRQTIGGQFSFVKRPCVAVLAARGAMLSFQCVLGIDIVVEGDRLPRLGPVARLALIAKEPFMTLLIIIFTVTGDTRLRRFLVASILVTRCALHINVLPKQWELRLTVIKIGVFPALFVVTVSTLEPQRPFMDILLAVTFHASIRSLRPLFRRVMALIAGHFDVLSKQLEVRLRMVETLFIETDDLCRASFVIGVTRTAYLRLHTAVIARFIHHVLGNFFMAINTALILSRAIKLDVAASAIALPFDVCVNELTGGKD